MARPKPLFSRVWVGGGHRQEERETNNYQICSGCQVREMRSLGDMIVKVLSSSDYIMTQNGLHCVLGRASL